MGLSQSKESFAPFIIETAAGESYFQKRSTVEGGFVTTLNRTDAIKALNDADFYDEFRHKLFLDTMNTLARKNLSYTPVNGPVLDSSYPGVRQTLRIVWLNSSAEAGMPHTRAPDLVCLPIYLPANMLAKTILHESIHVDQRKNPEKWVKWAVNEGWVLLQDTDIPERWLRRCRLNPDTMKYRFWAYRNRWVPLPLFENEQQPKLREIQIRWWDKRTGDLLADPPKEVSDMLGDTPNPEHPFEIAAYKDIHLD